MFVSLFVVLIAYGAALIAAALVLARRLYLLPDRELVLIAVAIFLYPIVPALIGSIASFPIWLAPFLEEPFKLAMIVALRRKGRVAILVCLAFAGLELMDKALSAISWPPVPMEFAVLWLAGNTGAVLMHCATGLIYSERGPGSTPALLCCAIALHLIHNMLASGIWSTGSLGSIAGFMFMLGVGEVCVVFALIRSMGPDPGAAMAPADSP